MPEHLQLKTQILKEEIGILQHYIEAAKYRPDINNTYTQIALSQNKTNLAQKEFSLAEITQKQITEKRNALYEEEEELIKQIEILLEKNWNAFPLQDFITQRIPNFMEAFIIAIPKSLIEIFIPDNLKDAPNPTARAFVRDITKIPSAFMMWNKAQQIGSTKYYFDDFLLAGTVSKTICKTSLILGSQYFGLFSPETISRISNYICEVPSRLLTKFSRIYQDTYSKEEINSQTTEDKMDFALKHMTSEAIYDAVYASISKTITTDALGTILGIISQVEFWTDEAHPSLYHSFVDKFFLRGVKQQTFPEETLKEIQDTLSKQKDPYTYIETIFTLSGGSAANSISKYFTEGTPVDKIKQAQSFIKPTHFINSFVGKFINSFVGKFITGYSFPKTNTFIKQMLKTFFDTYALTPPARIMEDIPGVFTKSDLKKTGYIPTKFTHAVDQIIDTKKDYGISEFISSCTSNHTASMEDNLIAVQAESGKLKSLHDEL